MQQRVSAPSSGPAAPAREGPGLSGIVWTVVLVALGVALVLTVLRGQGLLGPWGDDEEPAGTAGAGTPPGWEFDRPVGEVAPLDGGAVARVNSVVGDVTLPAGQPPPEPGTRLDRADVELCAGEESLFVDAAFWLGMGSDRVVHSAHMGVRDLLTIAVAPGNCQRGEVDLALPADIELEAVMLIDNTRETVAAWSLEQEPVPVDGPLRPTVAPQALDTGTAAQLLTSGTATLHDILLDAEPLDGGAAPGDGEALVRVEGEVCADEQPLTTGPRNWLLALDDHRLVTAERDVGTMASGDLEQGACDRGAAEFLVAADATVVGVLYTYGGVYEEARWRVPR